VKFQQEPRDHLHHNQQCRHAAKPEGEGKSQCRLLYLPGMKVEDQAKGILLMLFRCGILFHGLFRRDALKAKIIFSNIQKLARSSLPRNIGASTIVYQGNE
jgi:hypothetical protein